MYSKRTPLWNVIIDHLVARTLFSKKTDGDRKFYFFLYIFFFLFFSYFFYIFVASDAEISTDICFAFSSLISMRKFAQFRLIYNYIEFYL